MSHFAIIDESNDVYMFGENTDGQLGLGDIWCRKFPVKLENMPKIALAGTSYNFTVLVDVEGGVWHCGYLDEDKGKNLTPYKFFTNPKLVKIKCGMHHIILLDNEGNVFSFGTYACRMLGVGEELYDDDDDVDYLYLKPLKIENIPKIFKIRTSQYFSLLIDFDGFCWVFGLNTDDQLNLGVTDEIIYLPQKIPNVKNIVSASCGYDYFVLIDRDGNCYFCGYGEDSSPFGENLIRKPQKIEGLPRIIKSLCGLDRIILLDDKNNIWVCGSNSYGQLGINPDINDVPNFIKTDYKDIVDIIGSRHSTIIINKFGECFSFGWGIYGQLGREFNFSRTFDWKAERINGLKCKMKQRRFQMTKSARKLL